MAVKVLILEDNPVARSFLCRVVRESFSDAIEQHHRGRRPGNGAARSRWPAAPRARTASTRSN